MFCLGGLANHRRIPPHPGKWPRVSRRVLPPLLGWLVAGLLPGWSQGADIPVDVEYDPAKIVTTEFTKTPCRECHASEYEVWRTTTHASGFKNLHREKTAEKIASKMGFKLIKRDSLCLSCHYTGVVVNEKLRAVSGVSCESCHGPGRDWVNIHNDYGGKGFDHTNESVEHREARIKKSREGGMRRPSDLYPLIASCYRCHLVNNEKLVNLAGHNTGSRNFEYLEWSQGKIRHNFLQSFLTGDGRTNAERPIERKRLMYLAGAGVGLEYTLRGVAEAKQKGRYLSAMVRAVKDAKKRVGRIVRVLPLEELRAMLKAAAIDLRPDNAGALVAAANEIANLNKQLLANRDGTALQPLDALILGRPVADVDSEEVAAAAPGTVKSAEAVAEQNVAEGAGKAAVSRESKARGRGDGKVRTPVAAHGAVGTKKSRIRPPSPHKTIGPGKCVRCHDAADAWWLDDPHGLSAEPFFDQRAKNVKIARLYGLTPSSMVYGNRVCMDCHGSIISGREKREVGDGVGCESCHGPGESYLDPHEEGEKSLGLRRPGYVKALKLGMNELKNPSARAKACVACHYITDPRLISSGHPSGQGFDYAGGLTKIKHWQHADFEPEPWREAIRALLATKGPVPDVPRPPAIEPTAIEVTGGNTGSRESGVETKGKPSETGGVTSVVGSGQDSTTPANRPGSPSSSPVSGDEAGRSPPLPSLPGFPEIHDGTSVEDILLILKQRLELLHRMVRKWEQGEKP